MNKETPKNDPQERTDSEADKQAMERQSRKGAASHAEKDDLERWHKTNTH